VNALIFSRNTTCDILVLAQIKENGADSIFCVLSVHGVVCWWAAGNESG